MTGRVIAAPAKQAGTLDETTMGTSRLWSQRLIWLVCLLAAEGVAASTLPHPWLLGKSLATATISFSVALIVFGRGRVRAGYGRLHAPGGSWIGLHVVAAAIFCGSDYLLNQAVPERTLLLAAWYGAILLLPISLAGALFGIRRFVRLLMSLGSAWGLAAICGTLMVLGRAALIASWDASGDTAASGFGHVIEVSTFRGVTSLLGFFRSDLLSDPSRFVIGTQKFTVQIAGRCSGIEGLALMLCLTVGWIVYSRRELRLARAWLLVPASLTLIWLLNMVRIACLIAIGDAGYPEVADSGFHSEAGWIMFSLIALAFLFSVNGVRWFSRAGLVGEVRTGSLGSDAALAADNAAAVYLLPMLAILAAGFVSGAASAGFEWLYGLRLIAAAGVLCLYRREYRRMDWQSGWLGPSAGVLVFVVWIAAARWMGGEASAVANGLSNLGKLQRVLWIGVRVLAAVVTVPVAEELAFRGYVARRIMAVDVERVDYSRLTWVAIAGSAAAFGAMHGRMWLVGMAAGVVFGVVAKVRGRLGEAVMAHAVANGLIAVWVLARGDYSLW